MGFHFKLLFFDTKEVKSRVSEATRKVLSKFGAFVRQTAKQSIKTKPTTSQPGQPPHSHMGPAFEKELPKLPPNWRNSVK